MQIVPIPARLTDYAWKDGAHALGEACATEECTIDQLKLLISRGERQLIRMDNDGKTVGWCAFIINDLPNLRVLHVTNLTAHNAHFELFYSLLADMAREMGCSRIRCAASPAHERLYRMKLGFKPVYQIMETQL